MESVSLLSHCNRLYLSFLFNLTPNIRKIRLGHRTGVNDSTLDKIIGNLGQLEEFYVEHSSELTSASVEKLMDRCPKLRLLGDLSHWDSVAPAVLGELHRMTHETNLDLDLRCHQTLKKYLDMTTFQRKTYLNSVTGPSLERIRRAASNLNNHRP